VLDLLCGSLEMLPCDLRLEQLVSCRVLPPQRRALASSSSRSGRQPPARTRTSSTPRRRHTHGCLAMLGQSRQAAVRSHNLDREQVLDWQQRHVDALLSVSLGPIFLSLSLSLSTWAAVVIYSYILSSSFTLTAWWHVDFSRLTKHWWYICHEYYLKCASPCYFLINLFFDSSSIAYMILQTHSVFNWWCF
jgi:hypothetical protein